MYTYIIMYINIIYLRLSDCVVRCIVNLQKSSRSSMMNPISRYPSLQLNTTMPSTSQTLTISRLE